MNNYIKRNEEVCRLVLAGVPRAAIAKEYGITLARVSQIFVKSPEGESRHLAKLRAKVALYEDCCEDPDGRVGGRDCLPQWRATLVQARNQLATFEAMVAARRERAEAKTQAENQAKRFWENCLRNAP
jgi:hypothetical protein